VRADRPSSTAALIAAATVFLSRDAALAHFVPAGAADICERCLTARQLLPTRLRWIEQAVRSAITRGCRRVVIIGAGYDTLAARLAPVFPAVRFTEVDIPRRRR
jgi:O-methyltransferase involved in polyketide biosynthesis